MGLNLQGTDSDEIAFWQSYALLLARTKLSLQTCCKLLEHWVYLLCLCPDSVRPVLYNKFTNLQLLIPSLKWILGNISPS